MDSVSESEVVSGEVVSDENTEVVSEVVSATKKRKFGREPSWVFQEEHFTKDNLPHKSKKKFIHFIYNCLLKYL